MKRKPRRGGTHSDVHTAHTEKYFGETAAIVLLDVDYRAGKRTALQRNWTTLLQKKRAKQIVVLKNRVAAII